MADEINWVDKKADNNRWCTPDHVVARVARCRRGGIGLDPCAEPTNTAGAAYYYTEEDDGLIQDWSGYGLVFVNPPYSLTPEMRAAGITEPPIRNWARKINEEVSHGVPLVALLPCGARFSTGYWQDNILTEHLDVVCFWRGRIKFIDARTGKVGKSPNYDSMFYGFNVSTGLFTSAFHDAGAVFETSRLNV